jgi:cytochrome c oxidase subunit 2
MYVTDAIRIFYFSYFILLSLFFIWFIVKVSKPAAVKSTIEEPRKGMDKRELSFFTGIVIVVIIAHIITLSPLVPWQKWRLWSSPKVVQKINIEIENYKFKLPEKVLKIKKGEFVEFELSSKDVTYGFGVFRKNGTLVFQMQVLPVYKNRYVWNFNEPGKYDIRSTEYSGPNHNEMVLKDAIEVF